MERYLLFVISLILSIGVIEIEPSSEDMKNITTNFLKVLNVCKQELNLQSNVLSDFYHFWKEDYSLLNRDMGCAIVCMSKKFDLLDDTGKIRHGNTREFAKTSGADDAVASKIVELIHECENQYKSEADHCVRALEVAKCFRTSIHQLNWAPSVNVIISEILSDI